MTRVIRTCLLLVTVIVLASISLFAQRRFGLASPRFANTSWFPQFGGGFGFPSFGYPYFGYGYPGFVGPNSYLPNYWWVSPYPIGDPRQDGYNAYAGYEWDSVGTLILTTFPLKARVILDGVDVGTANYLGPTQLPAGDHTLRIEAPGYEPYEGVVKIEQPGFQLLDVQLRRAVVTPKLGPQS